MRLFALGIDQARDVFGADHQLAGRLRTVAGEHYPAPESPQKRSRLSRMLGPLFKTDDRMVVDPRRPSAADLDAILTGRYLPPDRLPAAWDVLELWFADLSWGELSLEISQHRFDEFEFALARVGLPSPYSLGQLMHNDASLPILPLPGLSVGYAKYQHALNTQHGLSAVIPELAPEDAQLAQQFAEFLAGFPLWASQATAAGQPEPDLLMIWHRAG